MISAASSDDGKIEQMRQAMVNYRDISRLIAASTQIITEFGG